MAHASLIIPTLDRQDYVRTLLGALGNQSVAPSEVLVVDQSDRPDPSIAAAGPPGLVRYHHLSRKSLPHARNVGAGLATGDILIFIDDDVELAEGFVAAHLAAYDDSQQVYTENDKCGDDALGKKQGIERLQSVKTFGEQHSVAAVAGRITGGYDDGPPNARLIGAVNSWTGVVTRNFHLTAARASVEQLPGGNFSVRRDAYFSVGGFDAEAFGGPASIGEESDFAHRLRRTGSRIIFEPKAHLLHLRLPRGGCRDESKLRWTWWHGHNMAVLARRYSPWYTLPVFLTVQTARYLAHAFRAFNPLLWFVGCAGTLTGLLDGRQAPGAIDSTEP